MNHRIANVFRLIIIGVLISVLGTSSLSAQIRGNNIVVTVTPDHQDWNYRVGEKANFTVNVRKSGTLLNQVKVDYEAGPAMFPEVKKSTTLKDGTMKWCGSLNRPGFYRLKVIAHVDGITRDFARQVSLQRRSSLSHRNLRISMLSGRRHWMRQDRMTSILPRCFCLSVVPRIRMYMKSVITTTYGALRCMAS